MFEEFSEDNCFSSCDYSCNNQWANTNELIQRRLRFKPRFNCVTQGCIMKLWWTPCMPPANQIWVNKQTSDEIIKPLLEKCTGWAQYFQSLRGETVWSLALSDTSVSLARWQQGEQAAAGVRTVFWYPLGSSQTSHLTDISDSVGGFNHLLHLFCIWEQCLWCVT